MRSVASLVPGKASKQASLRSLLLDAAVRLSSSLLLSMAATLQDMARIGQLRLRGAKLSGSWVGGPVTQWRFLCLLSPVQGRNGKTSTTLDRYVAAKTDRQILGSRDATGGLRHGRDKYAQKARQEAQSPCRLSSGPPISWACRASRLWG